MKINKSMLTEFPSSFKTKKNSWGNIIPAESTSKLDQGSRNTALTSFAGSMKSKGMKKNEILSSLIAINRIACKPPLSRSELINITNSIGFESDDG